MYFHPNIGPHDIKVINKMKQKFTKVNDDTCTTFFKNTMQIA